MSPTITNQLVRKNLPPTNSGEEDSDANVQDGILGGKYPSDLGLYNKDAQG